MASHSNALALPISVSPLPAGQDRITTSSRACVVQAHKVTAQTSPLAVQAQRQGQAVVNTACAPIFSSLCM
jgi:hypothetical protein